MITTAAGMKMQRTIDIWIRQTLVWMFILLMSASPSAAADDYLQITGPCRLVFPKDHGPHPEYRTEWWYFAGNLIDAEQRRYGFQLTFFRSRLTPPSARKAWPTPPSPWRTDQIYLAHAAITDIAEGRHHQAEKMARSVRSMSGAKNSESGWKIFVETWQATISADRHSLYADAGSFGLTLDLMPTKPLVLHGTDGYNLRGQSPERASCYYSFSRLSVAGSLTIDGLSKNVTGNAWMDHEFSTAPLEPDIVGWDWFSLQLSDNTEIMVFLLRQADGKLNPATSGTYVLSSGEARHLRKEKIRITPQAYWTSPHSGARYPVKWDVSIPLLQCNLTVAANLKDQEMRTPGSTNIEYWEGSVSVSGIKAKTPIKGHGYVEMTGYTRPFDADM